MSEQVRLTLEEVRGLTHDTLRANGLSAAHADAITEVITAAERDECKSHGLFRLPGYIASVRSGKVRPDAVPTVEVLAPSVVRVDGGGGYAPLAFRTGLPHLVERARSQGLAALVMNHIFNFQALWPEAETLASQGLVAFVYTSSFSYVAPAGGTKPLFGTNPMAFGWPRAGHPPLVFDQASSVSARGEIQIHLRDGKQIPEGWAIDPDGKPTTDPAAALAGAQLGFGGYKGASIALMVELLAGALIGDLFGFETTERDNGDGGAPAGGELVIAIDPARCVKGGDRAGQLAHAEQLFARILEQPGTRLPSERRYRARERTPTEGIVIPRSLHDEIVSLRGS
ncbi:MAG: Ldh family oxidoreductase [Ectothiorhodospiraceae bacterium]|nr:Ldh family oxidoreductase [Chromatiales bacterium]MCP5154489.1 Ldh family oxidoreductase [Ectothiorhodospiraceae bacterium]